MADQVITNRDTDSSCDVLYVHEEHVSAVAERMPPLKAIAGMAETFKLLGDPTRLRVVHALSYGELCVCDLAAMLSIAQPAISNHLRLLRSMNLVTYRRAGKMAYYSLADAHITSLLAECREHVEDLQPGTPARSQ